MATLPMEILEDTLLRLPASSLVRLRLLSKPTLSLIDSPNFTKSHLKRTLETQQHLMILLHGPNILRTAYLDSPNNLTNINHPLLTNGSTQVFGSCNGLVGLVNSPNDLAVFNPSTRKCHKLPYEPIDFPEHTIFAKDVFYGLGYDSVKDDYKVVRIVQSKHDQTQRRFRFPLEVKVYSLKKEAWKQVFLSFERQVQFLINYYDLLYRRGNGVLASNSLHWILPRMRGGNNAFNHITRFDLVTDEVGLVSFPLELRAEDDMDVGVLDGLLCLICYEPLSHVDVWVLTDYKGFESVAWSKMFRVLKPEGVERVELLRPLMYDEGKTKVLMEINSAANVMWFDLESKGLTRVGVKDCDGACGAEILVSSLVLGCNGKLRERGGFLSKGFKLKL